MGRHLGQRDSIEDDGRMGTNVMSPQLQIESVADAKRQSGFVRAKKYLAGHHDRRPAVRYFEPCYSILKLRYMHSPSK